MSILIKNIILDGKGQDIFIKDGLVEKIGHGLDFKAAEKIDGRGEKAILPGLVNCHTHAAMNLFRGYGDDLPLKTWLEKKIWPLEAKLTEDDVYWGTKLAILEMIKTGTTCFNDMYWYPEAVFAALEEMNLRGVIGPLIIDFDKRGSKENFEKFYRNAIAKTSDLISISVAPHSVYAVSKENLIWSKNFAAKNKINLHIHLSETEQEVSDCRKKYGCRPVEYLNKIGFLGKNVVLAHGIWLDDREVRILKEKECSVVYNPCSNMKLSSGTFPYKKATMEKINVCMGTDGATSNNSLDMFEEMKFASLLQKVEENNPTIAPAAEIFKIATKNGAKALKINAGEVGEGKLADLILIDLNKTFFSPGHSFVSDVVYAGSGLAVSDLICNGMVLMHNGKVEGEDEIIEKTRAIAKNLIKR